MTRRAVSTSDAPAPAGPYSQGIVSGGVIATAGQVGIDPATGQLAGPDIATQTRQAIANVAAVLQAAGSSLADVIRVTVYLADLDDFAAMNDVYRELMPAPQPARTTVAVGLPNGIRVEMDALAVIASA